MPVRPVFSARRLQVGVRVVCPTGTRGVLPPAPAGQLPSERGRSTGTLHPVAEVTPVVGPASEVEAERTWLDDRSWVDLWPGWLSGADALYEQLADDGRRSSRGASTATTTGSTSPVSAPGSRRPPRRTRPWSRPTASSSTATACASTAPRWPSTATAATWSRSTATGTCGGSTTRSSPCWCSGDRRPFLIRPRSNRYAHEAPDKGATHRLQPGHGDLMVMGGACQAGWEHSVPQVPGPVGGRISVQWRWTSKLGRMERGGSYRAPRHYGQG